MKGFTTSLHAQFSSVDQSASNHIPLISLYLGNFLIFSFNNSPNPTWKKSYYIDNNTISTGNISFIKWISTSICNLHEPVHQGRKANSLLRIHIWFEHLHTSLSNWIFWHKLCQWLDHMFLHIHFLKKNFKAKFKVWQ